MPRPQHLGRGEGNGFRAAGIQLLIRPLSSSSKQASVLGVVTIDNGLGVQWVPHDGQGIGAAAQYFNDSRTYKPDMIDWKDFGGSDQPSWQVITNTMHHVDDYPPSMAEHWPTPAATSRRL